MEIKIIEEEKNKMVFELDGEEHTFCNVLKNELWNDSHVKVATYKIDHPLVGKPVMILETDGADLRKTLISAAKRLQKEVANFKDLAKKNVK